jgi:CheY-like chemotaxis protein
MLPPTCELQHRTPSVRLRVPRESLQRIGVHLVLHARQAIRHGTVTLSMERRIIGGRHWACWRVEAEGDFQEPRELLGLAWLQQVVRQCHGMLECARNAHGGLWPAVYLPLDGPMAVLPPAPLLGKRIWLLDRDPLVRETLGSLVRQQGGEAETFDSLRELLRHSRRGPVPDVLVLEREPRLDRFQKGLRKLDRSAIPTLILGSGQALPLDPAAFGMQQVGFLDKPFPSQDFLQSLLALSEPSPAMEGPPA